MATTALDIIKNKTGLNDAQANEALKIKNTGGAQAFLDYVAKNKPAQAAQVQNPPVVPPQQTTPPQTVTGVNGEQFQVAPVNPQTGLSQPTPVTPDTTKPIIPVQEIAKSPTEQQINQAREVAKSVTPITPVKTEAPIDYNTSVGREADIQKNISEITKTSPNLLKDRNAFNQAFGYETADVGKKALLDSAFLGGNQPMNQKDVLNAFISGVSVPEQNTQAYRNAKVQYDTFKKFNAMTPTQLLDNLKQGQIGSDMDSLLSQNPGYIEAKQKLAQIQRTASLNRMGQSALGVINGKEPEDLSDLSKVEAKYNAPPGTNVDAYQSYVVNNEDVKKAGVALKSIATQISDVTKTYNDALKSLKEQYGDMPASALLTLMTSRTKDTKSLLDSLIDAKTLAQGDFDLAMKMGEGSYDAYSKDLANQNEIAKEQRAIDNSIKLSQMQFDQKLEQNAMLAKDPTTAIGNILKQFSELGIIPDRDVAWHVAEQKRLGMTLPEYTQKIIVDFKAKPQYKAMEAANMRELAPEPTKREESDWQIVTIDGKSYERNKYTGETRNISVGGTTNIPSGKSLFDVLGKNVGTYEGNRGYDLAGALGDPLPAGGNWTVKSIDTAGEQAGSIFIGGKGSKPYGNTVVMEDENGNTIRYSHLQDINVQPGDILSFGATVGTRGNTGNVLGANGEKLTAEQLKAGRGAHLDVEIKDKNGRLLSQSEQVNFLKGLKKDEPLTDKQFTQSNQVITSFKSDPQVKAFEEAYSQGMSLIASLNDKTGPGDVAAIFQFMKTLDPASVVRESEFEVAAKSAGVGQYIGNTWDRITQGKKLTESQAEAFGKLAKQFIIDKAKLYDAKYNDGIRRLEKQGIDTSVFPVSTADQMRQSLGAKNTTQQINTSGITGESLVTKWKNF